jgi:hypothetical protein
VQWNIPDMMLHTFSHGSETNGTLGTLPRLCGEAARPVLINFASPKINVLSGL